MKIWKFPFKKQTVRRPFIEHCFLHMLGEFSRAKLILERKRKQTAKAQNLVKMRHGLAENQHDLFLTG